MNSSGTDIEVSPSLIRRRRRLGAEFKASVLAACRQPGISIASAAPANGLNANLLRRWVGDAEVAGSSSRPSISQAPSPTGFISLPLTVIAAAASTDICIEIQRNGTTVVVSWPTSAASACTVWLRKLLR